MPNNRPWGREALARDSRAGLAAGHPPSIRSERSEEGHQRRALRIAQALKSLTGLSRMPVDGFVECGRAIVQKRAAKPQAPERWCADFVRLRRALVDAVAGADVVEQKV